MRDQQYLMRCLWKGIADTDQQQDAADHIEELLTKLARAVKALDDLAIAFSTVTDVVTPPYRKPYEHPLSAYDRAIATFVELTGEKDD